MAGEKSFLQTIKLEISRAFKLVPYERLAFHKILGILKSETGLNILIKELDKGPDIRESAISTLTKFDSPEVISVLGPFLKINISNTEKIMILDHAERNAGMENIPDYIDFIKNHKDNPDLKLVISKAFDVLMKIGKGSDEVLNFLISIINSKEIDPQIKTFAIESLSSFKSISNFEELLKMSDDAFSYSIYRAIYILVNDLTDKADQMKTDDDRIFTYSPDNEDKIILGIRVLLGKMTPEFNSYSNRTKIAFICAMISCNHREYLIYTMKALTANDVELVSMVLYSLFSNINRLRDPDKLFRNLIAISTEVDRFNELIVDIFARYFNTPNNTRQFNLLKDKLFGYIIVTLESYFETYRKEFMITDVIEKGYPENFQRIRKFILKYYKPELKKEIVTFLTQENPSAINHLLDDISKWITFIDEDDKEDLSLLIEVLMDNDKKSRENSSLRIEDLNFEKLYLRNRIIRLCGIIGLLHINDASSILVNIYNYLKKYPDKEIMNATIHTLSMLNYSYMLGEIEVLLTTGSETDQKKALQLISLFTEQRSLNIILELLKNRINDESEIVESAVSILLVRDIVGNITASQIFKGIIEVNKSQNIRSLAVLGIGQCGFDSDIEFLNDLFNKMGKDESKDVIVRAIANIISYGKNLNKRNIMRYLQEYLKDPGIKVRIYSCLLLAWLGSKNAIRSIREMLIIKNKSIQRDILTILGDLKSIEFSFFLLSLLKEEYGISKDIIPVIEKLPEEDMKEIDGFIVNIFRKYEAPHLEGMDFNQSNKIEITLTGLKKEEMTILSILVSDSSLRDDKQNIPELINLNLIIKSLIVSVIVEHGGTITRMSNSNIISCFADPVAAANASIKITKNMNEFNESRVSEKCINVYLHLITDTVKIINNEIIEFPLNISIQFNEIPIKNKIITDGKTVEHIKAGFSVKKIPEMVLSKSIESREYFELLSTINFLDVTKNVINAIKEKHEEKEQMQTQIDDEIKKIRRERRSTSTVTIARELDSIGEKLQSQLHEIETYVQKRSTDRELIKNVRRMLSNTHNLYKVEISRIIID